MILANLVDAITDPATLLMTLLMLFGVLLIIIILLQKGRGGGLAGAFGGSGGQSALGTKAGDVFTKITIVMAVIWVILAGVSGITTRASSGKYEGGSDAVVSGASATDDAKTEETPDKDIPEADAFKDPKDLKETPATPDSKPAKADEKSETAKPETAKPTETKPPADKTPAEKKEEAPAKKETPKSDTKSE